MISRRKFLKLAGLSTLAVGAGYTTGKLTGHSRSVYYSIHGFIPGDELVIKNLVTTFKKKIASNSEPIIIADSKFGEVITKADLRLRNINFKNSGTIIYRLKKLTKKTDADLIVSDPNNPIYSLDDFNFTILNLRNNLKGRSADYLFTAEYNEVDFLSSIFRSNKKEAIIENEKGLVDNFSLDKNFENILVDGPQGKTEIKIKNGIVRVHSSTCRHKVCKQTFAQDSWEYYRMCSEQSIN